MNVLFVCNQGKHRSKTAAELFKHEFATKSSGLFCPRPLTEAQFSWADLVIVMEDHQRTELSKRFPKLYLQKQILSLDIPDIYRYQQPELVKHLKEKMLSLTNLQIAP